MLLNLHIKHVWLDVGLFVVHGKETETERREETDKDRETERAHA